MSLEDEEPPVHRISRVEDRERILAEAMAHAEAQEHQYRVVSLREAERRRWKAPASLVLFAIAACWAVFPPRWLSPPPIPSVQVGERERGLRVALYLQAQQVEAFHLAEGRLPISLDEVPIHAEGFRFVRSDNRLYQLVGVRPNGGFLVYDSGNPDPSFERSVAPWLAASTR